MKFNKSKYIVNEELNYYDAYIQESLYYVMNTIEYHSQSGTLTDGLKHSLAIEMREVFDNFGMGICLNVNKTFRDMNVYQSNHVVPPDSPPMDIPSPPTDSPITDSPPSIINTGLDIDAYNQTITSSSAPTIASPLASLLSNEALPSI